MDTKRWQCILILVAVTMVNLGAWVGDAGAMRYLGEFTWIVQKTHDENGPIIPLPPAGQAVYSLSLMGGTNYIVQGKVGLPWSDPPVISNGGGSIIGNYLFLNITTSKDESDHLDVSTTYAKIDKFTFNGTYSAMKKGFDKSAKLFQDRYEAGTVTLTGPPPPLGPNVTQLMLLLE